MITAAGTHLQDPGRIIYGSKGETRLGCKLFLGRANLSGVRVGSSTTADVLSQVQASIHD